MSPRIRDAWGLRHSAHGFGRGKALRSSRRTRTPRRASWNAVLAPAGPPPTTMASLVMRRASEKTGTGCPNQRAADRADHVHAVVVQPPDAPRQFCRRTAAMLALLGDRVAGCAPATCLQRGADDRV